jgi:LacI family transcriptional regulator
MTRQMVNSETARRVTAAANRLGYTPNRVASGFAKRKSFSIGVVIPDLTNPLFPPIARGIEDALNERGYVALLVNTDNDDERELKLVETLRSRQVDGFIVATARLSHPLLETMAHWSTPTVLINRVMDHDGFSSVVGNDAAGVHAAVDHLAQLGHRRIVHLAGPDYLSTGRIRSQAFAEAMRGHRFRIRKADVVTCESYSVSAGYAAGRRLFATQADVTAIFASNDLIALGAMQAIRDEGLVCPGDVSIVGFNDMPFVDQSSPPLTTIRLPQYAVGVQAAELLLERLTNPEAAVKSVLLPVELVVRDSTGPCMPRPSAKS